MARRAGLVREVHTNGSPTTQQDTALPSITGRNVQDATTNTSVISTTSPIRCLIGQRPSLPLVGEMLPGKRPSIPVKPEVLVIIYV